MILRMAFLLLHLADNLTGTRQTLHHLLAFFPPADRVVALLQQVVEFGITVHVFEQLTLHLVLRESRDVSVIHSRKSLDTYSTRVYIIALGTMSIIVRLTML